MDNKLQNDEKMEKLLNELAAIGDCIGSMQHGINRYDTETSNAMGYLGAKVKALSFEIDDLYRKLMKEKNS